MKNNTDKNIPEFIKSDENENQIDPESKDETRRMIIELWNCVRQSNIDKEKINYLLDQVE